MKAIRHALKNGLTVFTELGKKLPDQPLNAEEAIETANRDIEAGAKLVVVEKADVALVIRNKSDTLHRLIRGVGHEHLVIECGPGADRFDIAKWLIAEFGPDAARFRALATRDPDGHPVLVSSIEGSTSYDVSDRPKREEAVR